MPRVLVVDDEENIRLVLRTLLRKEGYDVETVASAEDALERHDAFQPDYILADVRMGGMTGLDLCRELSARHSMSTVIVMSAFGSVDLAIEAMKAGAYDYVSKPFKQDEILLSLRKAEEREELKRENAALKREMREAATFQNMVGRSQGIEHVFRLVEKVAHFSTTVLILGESGTGKELVARAIHQASERSEASFVAINCGAIPEHLLESELFGHCRGAFTDARTDKRGLFETAHEGTLFLDEVAELPMATQVKLLRVLQEGTLRRLGETNDRKIDVRVLAATHRNLSLAVEDGAFREDLYYRLNVLAIEVPPLRERRDDIPMLIDFFIEKNNLRLGTTIRGMASEASKLMIGYPWPGNIRELENVVERAIVLAEGAVLGVQDLPDRLREPAPVQLLLRSGELSIKKSTRFIERELIVKALEKTGGNRTQAAKLLEISHRALLYKIKDYGVT